MLRNGSIRLAALACALALAACGKKNTTDNASPLAFAPADTPYVLANVEPMPEAAMARWNEQTQQAWPLLLPMLESTSRQVAKEAPQTSAFLKALVDEMRNIKGPQQWQELGLGPKTRVALYGIGMLPVLRLESPNIDGLKTTFERVVKTSGAQLGTARLGEQDVRTLDAKEALILFAFEGRHFVIALVPKAADDALKRRVLGMDRPGQSLADSGALSAFEKTNGYLPYGSGWLDTRRLLALIGTPEAGVPTTAIDATCRSEYDALATKMPRLSFGYTKLDGNLMEFRMRLELERALAKSLLDLGSSVPGNARPDALYDMALALPVLKTRDFIVAQADAVAKAPFQCKELASLNEEFAKAKTSLDKVLPPPVADLTGVRISLDRFVMPADLKTMPTDYAGSVLIGSNNPMFLVGLAQMSVPALQKLHLNPDGKPLALPAEALGALGGKLDVNVALGAKTLGIAVGASAADGLSAAVMQTPTANGTFMSFDASGRIYTLLGDLFGSQTFADVLPAEQRESLELQRQLYALYAQWFKHIHARLAFVPEGVDLVESIELNPPAAAVSVAQ